MKQIGVLVLVCLAGVQVLSGQTARRPARPAPAAPAAPKAPAAPAKPRGEVRVPFQTR